MKIGDTIKEKRLQKGMTQEELALKSDITVRTIQRIENGEVDPRAYTLLMIAKALDVDFGYFSDNDPDKYSEKQKEENKIWLGLLHLSGLFLLIFPTVMIWNQKKEIFENINEHFYEIINFQLSVLILMILPGIFYLLIFKEPIGIYGGFIFGAINTILNTIRIFKDKPHKYIFLIKLMDKKGRTDINSK